MKKMLMIGVVLMAGCGPSQPKDTLESFVAYPDHLRKVEKQCADDYAKMGAAECNAASEARHRLFMGNGPQYTPPKEQPKF
ncbi:EexN family lipoprotein [Caballeronia sp. LP003]|uniref:EexN family lipoprotein n=1 Tax=Caballeronia sp. LP003 TaxID=3038551 RepID=UPI00285C50C3|nr:EexN family lipoprotein [Caballeronia sp. LP003]MDR5785291.1 EexN family lipoprotein [Caballeronia sp. LP003]